MGDMGIGGIAGTTNINTRPSQMRKGLRASVVNGNSMYRFRGMVTYSSGNRTMAGPMPSPYQPVREVILM